MPSARTTRVLKFMAANHIPVHPLASNRVVICKDDSCDMAEVLVNGHSVMMGNTWDFHPGCHGFNLPDFQTPEDLAELFLNALKAEGKQAEIIEDLDWTYEG